MRLCTLCILRDLKMHNDSPRKWLRLRLKGLRTQHGWVFITIAGYCYNKRLVHRCSDCLEKSKTRQKWLQIDGFIQHFVGDCFGKIWEEGRGSHDSSSTRTSVSPWGSLETALFAMSCTNRRQSRRPTVDIDREGHAQGLGCASTFDCPRLSMTITRPTKLPGA